MSRARSLHQRTVCPVSGLSRREERLNWLTHGLGALLAVAGTAALVTRAGQWGTSRHIVSVAVFGAALVALYGISALYHGAWNLRWKRTLRIGDHVAIFLLIAASYTPFTLIALRDGWRWSLFGVIWGLAAAGIVLKLILRERATTLFTITYLAVGWVGAVGFVPLWRALPTDGFALLVGGGAAYTAGALFYHWDERIPYFHTVFHLLVLGGSACHFWVVMHCLVPMS